MTNARNIFFDLDGTLTDPREGIVRSILYALDRMGIEELRPEELELFVGPPLRDSFALRYSLSHDDATKAVAFYREYFAERGLFENRVYDGIEELLMQLRSADRQLFVATSKPTVYSQQIIEHFALAGYFKDIVGSNLDNSRTDKAEVIAAILETHTLAPQTCVMIGDRKHDLLGAARHGMAAIGVSYGYGSIEELSEHGARAIADSPLALCQYLLPQSK